MIKKKSEDSKRLVGQQPHKQITCDKPAWTEPALDLSWVCVISKRHWPSTSPLWLKNSGKVFFVLGRFLQPSVFSSSLQCPRQRFWPLEGHLTTEISYRYVLVVGEVVGPLPCLLLLKARHCPIRTASVPSPADVWQSDYHIMGLSVSYWDTEHFWM